MAVTAIYPGTFDPITFGHIDIAQRAIRLFDKLILAVADSPEKKPLFTLEERIDLAQQVLAKHPNIEVVGFNSLLVEFAIQQQVQVIIRGLRAVSDFEYEFQMACMNSVLDKRLDTVFLPTSSQYTFLSSTLVREVSKLGGDVTTFVDPLVIDALDKKIHLL